MNTKRELEARRFWIVNELWEGPTPTRERASELYAEWMAVERALVRMGESI